MNIFLGLGSNLGDRGKNLQQALVALERWGVKIVRASSVYESEPVDYAGQPWFYNMVVLAETNVSPEELLKILHAIEQTFGRDRAHEVRFGPRTLDIDILFYGEHMVDIPGLQIPHPRLHERKFVLVPMMEIAPEFVHPSLGKSMRELLNRLLGMISGSTPEGLENR